MAVIVPTHFKSTSAKKEVRYYSDRKHALDFAKSSRRVITIESYVIIQAEKDKTLGEGSVLTEKAKLFLHKSLEMIYEEELISVRTYNVLKIAKIDSVKLLVSFTTNDLLKLRNFGKKNLIELEKMLQENDLYFGISLTDFE